MNPGNRRCHAHAQDRVPDRRRLYLFRGTGRRDQHFHQPSRDLLFLHYRTVGGWGVLAQPVRANDGLEGYIDMRLGPQGPLEATNVQISFVTADNGTSGRVVDLIPHPRI